MPVVGSGLCLPLPRYKTASRGTNSCYQVVKALPFPTWLHKPSNSPSPASSSHPTISATLMQCCCPTITSCSCHGVLPCCYLRSSLDPYITIPSLPAPATPLWTATPMAPRLVLHLSLAVLLPSPPLERPFPFSPLLCPSALPLFSKAYPPTHPKTHLHLPTSSSETSLGLF